MDLLAASSTGRPARPARAPLRCRRADRKRWRVRSVLARHRAIVARWTRRVPPARRWQPPRPADGPLAADRSMEPAQARAGFAAVPAPGELPAPGGLPAPGQVPAPGW